LFHVYGLNAVLGQVLACGATLVLAEQFDVEATLQLIVERSVTNVPVAPPVIAAWAGRAGAAEALAGVRVLLSGAAPLDPELAALMTRTSGVPVEQGYGLTEAAPVVTSTLTSGARAAGRNPDPAGVGGPLPGVELEVRDATGASTDEPGQIWVRGPTCSPATGPMEPTARRPMAGGAPATSAFSTQMATSSWSTGSASSSSSPASTCTPAR
jgi:long-chain acyl-CoA synthetase